MLHFHDHKITTLNDRIGWSNSLQEGFLGEARLWVCAIVHLRVRQTPHLEEDGELYLRVGGRCCCLSVSKRQEDKYTKFKLDI